MKTDGCVPKPFASLELENVNGFTSSLLGGKNIRFGDQAGGDNVRFGCWVKVISLFTNAVDQWFKLKVLISSSVSIIRGFKRGVASPYIFID